MLLFLCFSCFVCHTTVPQASNSFNLNKLEFTLTNLCLTLLLQAVAHQGPWRLVHLGADGHGRLADRLALLLVFDPLLPEIAGLHLCNSAKLTVNLKYPLLSDLMTLKRECIRNCIMQSGVAKSNTNGLNTYMYSIVCTCQSDNKINALM